MSNPNYYALNNTGSADLLLLNPQEPPNYLLLNPEQPNGLGSVYTQFQNATNLNNLLNGLIPYLTIPQDQFFSDFFNIFTCNIQGLTNWGYILNINSTVNVPNLTNIFGFNNGSALADGQYPCNFGMGNFYNGELEPILLDNNAFRNLLLLRYAYITTNSSMASINAALNFYVTTLNSTYKAFVYATSPKNLTYAFNFTFTNIQRAIFNQPGILPIPVATSYIIVTGAVL